MEAHVNPGEHNEDNAVTTPTMYKRIQKAYATMAELLVEINYLERQVLPQLEIEYEIKLGALDRACFRAQIDQHRSHLKLQRAKVLFDRGELIDELALDRYLDAYFAPWEERFDAMTYASLMMENKEESSSMTEEQEQTFKTLHRLLVKRLHPELNPTLSNYGIACFYAAQKLFEVGDIEALQAIDAATQGLAYRLTEALVDKTEDELHLELELFNARIKVFEERLQYLKQQRIYVLRNLLNNPQWLEIQSEKAKREIKMEQELQNQFEQSFRFLIKRQMNS